MIFEQALNDVLNIEGGYSNHRFDRGGKTMFGITEQVAIANGYDGDIAAMPIDVAKRIYKRQYWDVLRLDDIGAMDYEIAREMFDTAVNMGVGTAGTFLQRSLNALNRNGKLYQDVTVDGVVGPVTVSCLSVYLGQRGEEGRVVLMRCLNSMQGARYIAICESNPTQEEFLFGWMLNRVN